MKLSKFLAEHIVNREDFCAGSVCDTEEYEAMLELMGDEIAEGIVKYQEYLADLNTSRYSVAAWALQQIEALGKMESEHDAKPICPISKYTDKDSTIIDHKRCDFNLYNPTAPADLRCTQACFLKLETCSNKFNNIKNYSRIKIDPVCLMHGKKMSEHECLYCSLCFKDLTLDECNIAADGKKEDVCKPCAKREAEDEQEFHALMPEVPDWFIIGLSVVALIVIVLKIWGKI